MPEAFPTIEQGGPIPRRLYQLAPEWPTVRGPVFADGGQDTFLSSATPIRRWVADYELLTEEEAQMLDEHFASTYGMHLGFAFTDPDTGEAYTGVKYERYERPGEDMEWIQARSVQLIKRP